MKTNVMLLMMELLTGDPERAIEAAKQLISVSSEIDPEFLTKIVSDPDYKLWSKVAASYVLGFIPLTPTSEHHHVLRHTLADSGNSIRVRSHAAEALGNLKDEGSAALLRERLMDAKESRSVRKWCIYALGEMGTSEALESLANFAKTEPQGVLGQELQLVRD